MSQTLGEHHAVLTDCERAPRLPRLGVAPSAEGAEGSSELLKDIKTSHEPGVPCLAEKGHPYTSRSQSNRRLWKRMDSWLAVPCCFSLSTSASTRSPPLPSAAQLPGLGRSPGQTSGESGPGGPGDPPGVSRSPVPEREENHHPSDSTFWTSRSLRKDRSKKLSSLGGGLDSY